MNDKDSLIDLFIDLVSYMLNLSQKNGEEQQIKEIFGFLENIKDAGLSIRIIEELLKRFKSGKINQLASERMEVLQEIRQIEERQEAIEEKD